MSHEETGDSINIKSIKGVVATTISGGTINQNFNESPENNKFKKDRLRLIRVVQKEIEDRLAIFKRRNKYINLSLESKPKFVSQIDLLTGKKKQKVDNKELQDIEALFNLFKAEVLPQSLLIVGNPASGKSTILCTIAEILLEKAIKDEKQPVPVYLSIRSWKEEPLKDWLEKAINEHYSTPFEKKEGLEIILYKILGSRIYNRIFASKKSQLIEPENLVILLDHFELVQDNKQEKFIKVLNEYKNYNIVLCSRLEAWNQYVSKDKNQPHNNNKLLEFNEAFLLKLPTSSQISDYSDLLLTESNSDNTNRLKTLIEPGQQLEDITKSLFILNLVLDHIDNYEKLIKGEISNLKGKEEIYQYILSLYIEDRLKEIDEQVDNPEEYKDFKPLEKPYWEYIKPKVKPMLKWLAQQMCDHLPGKNDKPKPYFLIEEIQPTSLKGIQRTFYDFGSVLLAVLLSFLAGTLHLLIQPSDGWKYTLLTGISGAIFVFFFFLDGKEYIKPVDRIEWNFKIAKENSLKALFLFPVAFTIGFICSSLEKLGIIELYQKGFEQFTKGSISDLILGIIYTIIIIAMIMVLYSVTVGISSSSVKKVKPNQSIWTSIYNCGVTGFRVFLFASIIFWLLGLIIQKHPLMLATRFGIGYGLIAGLLYAIGCNSGRACIRHFTLRFILFVAGRGRIPWNYAKFLDVAVDDLEFLQRAGGKYLFLNNELRQNFLNFE